MIPGLELIIAFYMTVWRSDTAPKEMLLKMAECDDAETLELFMILDIELNKLKNEERSKNS